MLAHDAGAKRVRRAFVQVGRGASTLQTKSPVASFAMCVGRTCPADLQAELQKIAGSAVPLILMTGHGDIGMTVPAVKAEPSIFSKSLFLSDRLISAIRTARRQNATQAAEARAAASGRASANELSVRRRRSDLAVKGLSNKEIALALNISPRTVETYRAWVMEKTDTQFGGAVRLVMRLEEAHGPAS